MSTYQIAEVAQRTGFTPATLRYYEDIGLMAPTSRTPAGYRLYDDVSLERLHFIARAKQLGCTLDEITDLATAWDGGECGPLQDQLQSTVDAKIVEAQGRIAQLTTFTAELQRAAAALGRHRPEGPCDDACGCANDISTAPTSAMVVSHSDASDTSRAGTTSVQLVDKADATTDEAPVACTLAAEQMSGRVEEWQDLLAGVTDRLPLDDGVRLEFGTEAQVAEIARLAAAEQGCCRFFSFAVTVDHRGVALEVRAPADAADVVTAMFGTADAAGRLRRVRPGPASP